MPYTYVIQSELTGHFYIGSCVNMDSRLYDHNHGNTASTKNQRPWKLVYSKEFEKLSDARKQERIIKSWKSRIYMIKMLGLNVPLG
jgi:putative endonuclease